MNYPIEKHIPITRPRYRVTKYPLPEMEIGDSFVVPIKYKSGAASSALNWGMRQEPERKFTTRTSEDNKTVRIWRTQ